MGISIYSLPPHADEILNRLTVQRALSSGEAQPGKECVEITPGRGWVGIPWMSLKELDESGRLWRASRHEAVFAGFDRAEKTEKCFMVPVGTHPLHPVRDRGMVEDKPYLSFGVDRLNSPYRVISRGVDE
jgi:hypothetical protein